jgi:signal transduction histidine kinase
MTHSLFVCLLLQYTRAEGHIGFEINAAMPPDASAFSGPQAGRIIVFRVNDTGIGMTADTQAHLFEPFVRGYEASAARAIGGTGLGLVIAQRLVHMMHGVIDVSSTVAVGTCVSVRIPFLKAPDTSTPSPLNVARSLAREESKQKVVLVVV